LFRGLVQTDQWPIRIARPRIDRQNVFHRRHERGVGCWWNDPLFSQVRFENVFLRPADRIVAGTLDDAQFHDLFLQETERPLRVTGWRFGAGECDQPGLFLTVEDAADGRPLALFALEYRVKTLFDQPLPRPVNGREAGIEGRHDTFVIPALTSVGNIGLEQDSRLQDLSGGVRTLVDDRFERLTFFQTQSDNVLPELDLWHGFDAVLTRKHSPNSARKRIFDGAAEAKLIALACSEPPKGRARWTLSLLEDKVVELNIVAKTSDNTIERTLKKHAQTAPETAIRYSAGGERGVRGCHGRCAGSLS
jgi:hypothetical protein